MTMTHRNTKVNGKKHNPLAGIVPGFSLTPKATPYKSERITQVESLGESSFPNCLAELHGNFALGPWAANRRILGHPTSKKCR